MEGEWRRLGSARWDAAVEIVDRQVRGGGKETLAGLIQSHSELVHALPRVVGVTAAGMSYRAPIGMRSSYACSGRSPSPIRTPIHSEQVCDSGASS